MSQFSKKVILITILAASLLTISKLYAASNDQTNSPSISSPILNEGR
jgi:hypothetical protein